MHYYIQILQVKEDPTNYPVGSYSRHRDIVLVSGWCVLSSHLPWDNI